MSRGQRHVITSQAHRVLVIDEDAAVAEEGDSWVTLEMLVRRQGEWQPPKLLRVTLRELRAIVAHMTTEDL